ncbi:MAG TPA: hypothetical protein VGN88_05910, partial [Phycisphaerae bacterium]
MAAPPTPPESSPQPGRTPGAKPSQALRRAYQGSKPSSRPPRSYPKPPPLIQRFLRLCLLPESWAQAARYPTHVTLVPLILTIFFGIFIVAVAQTTRQVVHLQEFAATYDAKYPPLEINSEGILSVKGELKGPIRVPLMGSDVLVDPTGKTVPLEENATHIFAVVSSDHVETVTRDSDGNPAEQRTLKQLAMPPLSVFDLPEAGKTRVIDGPVISNYLSNRMPLFIGGGIMVFAGQLAAESLWALAMVIFLSPLI